MNPLIIIVVFVALLAGLLYYLQGRQEKDTSDVLPRASSGKTDKTIVKASEYQAQYEKEKATEEPEPEPKKEPEAEPEPVKEEPEPAPEPETVEDEDISTLGGVGPKYQELLRAAGYNTVKSIADSTPEELHGKLLEANNEHEITKRPPTMSNVEDWIASAKNR